MPPRLGGSSLSQSPRFTATHEPAGSGAPATDRHVAADVGHPKAHVGEIAADEVQFVGNVLQGEEATLFRAQFGAVFPADLVLPVCGHDPHPCATAQYGTNVEQNW